MTHADHRTCICMFTPTASGGHARYAWELLNALSKHDVRCELVTSEDLDSQFRSETYAIHSILPPLRHRNSFSTRFAWAISRLAHYPRREWMFLRWLKTRS